MSGPGSGNKAGRAALIVGAGYGALKSAEDLAQSGVPVVWVTRDNHFLTLPRGIESFKEQPVDLNFQFRPLYLRVTRHPLVTALTHARLESVKPDKKGFKVKLVQDPLFIDYDLCTGCGKCLDLCPLHESDHPPIYRSPAYCPSRALELDKRMLPPCRTACPLGVNVQAYLALTAASRFEEALAVIREDNPLPGVCGRICHHPCEAECRRSELDQPLAIRDLKRFLADHETLSGPARLNLPERKLRDEKVAVIGSGPAGLTAAHFLNRAGLPVTVFEALPEPGGLLRAGINAFRLPRRVLDRELEALRESGIEIQCNAAVSSLDRLFEQGFAAVLLATGAHCDLRLDLPGEELEGVFHCVNFLKKVNLQGGAKIGARTLVIGGGNSAMDAARTALRLGAETVVAAAIEKVDELPAHPREVREAGEEGVEFKLGYAPVALTGKDRIESVTLRPAHWEFSEGSPPRIVYDSDQTLTVAVDAVIVAISQRPHLFECGLDQEIETGRAGRVSVDEALCTSRPGVFAAGDAVTGPSTVIQAMAQGRSAAGRIIEHLTGEKHEFTGLRPDSRGAGDYLEISEATLRRGRQEMAQRQPRVRCRDFDEVDYGFTREQALDEARRCLQCGSCCECRACESACAEIGAIDHFRAPRRLEFISPSIIVADDEEMPDKSWGEDQGVYRIEPKEKKPDLMNVLVAGSAAAGKAMSRSFHLRQPRLPQKPEPLEFHDELRLGVFICTCNGTAGSETLMNRVREFAGSIPGVIHSELIVSACHPRVSEEVARTFRRKKLSRAILASCVCCPLEFECISCNDQRTRARQNLFDRQGLPRSRFETVNLRDHLHRGTGSEDELFERARDILRMAYLRARVMGHLRQGYTEIGKQILVLGGSEIGISCAMNLDHQGFRVRLVHACHLADDSEPPPARKPDLGLGKRIAHVGEAVIEEIQGHMGNFTVVAREIGDKSVAATISDKGAATSDKSAATISDKGGAGPRKRWKADMICLTDDNVLPLAIHEDMMGLKKFYRYNFSFFHTPQAGIYRVLPRTLERVSAFEAGAALAAQVSTASAEAFLKDHELSPRVDPDRCRGCGRCAEICPFNAIQLAPDQDGVYHSQVLYHNCVGCGGCVGRCPVTAMDIPYFSNQVLKDMVIGTLSGER